jgi:hypothetical protein
VAPAPARPLCILRLRCTNLPVPPLALPQTILDNSTSPYAQVLASSSLIKIVTEHSLSGQVKLEMRSYFLTYLDRSVAALGRPCRMLGAWRAELGAGCRVLGVAWRAEAAHPAATRLRPLGLLIPICETPATPLPPPACPPARLSACLQPWAPAGALCGHLPHPAALPHDQAGLV